MESCWPPLQTCPECVWPDPKHTSSFEFCDNGARTVAWVATEKRCAPDFFAMHPVSELQSWDDYDLEMVGRLTEPMVYDPKTDHCRPIGWHAAFELVARHLNALDDPNEADFYTSGRSSNDEVHLLFRLFSRQSHAHGRREKPDGVTVLRPRWIYRQWKPAHAVRTVLQTSICRRKLSPPRGI